ncbi:beta strand repeat-containing protein [Methylocystis sp.]|uniref:beta strand repeat-containing protein n=1 Tax=Methylocystis sp. TaxID=1911079 RepID=UPI003DA42E19
MHAVAAFFASIITFVSGFFAPTIASNSPVNVQTTQPAAAAAAQAEIAGNPFTDPAAASVVAAASAAALAPTPPQAQTVINQPVIERIIERVVPQGASGISADKLTAILTDFGQSIENRITAINPPKAAISEQVAAAGNATGAFFPASQRIDQLTNTTINTPTITGGTISGANVSGYLPLSGGTLTGTLTGTDLTLSGALTAGALNVTSIASTGALTGPYFTATSTTATSSFAGGLTAASSAFNILQNGNVGIGTASPSRALHVYDSVNSYILVQGGNLGGLLLQGTTTSSGMPAYGNINTYTDGSLRIQASSAGWVAAATQLTLATSGNVGIGTTTPWGKLSIKGSGTGTGLAFAVADSANTPRFVIQDNGNVGIGTTTPYSKLHTVIGNSTAKGVLLSTSDWIFGTAGSGVLIKTGADTGNTYTEIDAVQSGAGSGGTLVLNNNSGNVGIGTTTPWGKLSITGSGTGTGLAFAVADSANTPRFVIQDNGNVGIGTTTPGSLLSLNNIANFTTATSTFYSAGGINLAAGCFAIANNCLSFSNLTGTLGIAQGGTGTTTQVTNGVTYFDGTRITSGAGLTFTGTNLGVGTTSPAFNFATNGTIGASGLYSNAAPSAAALPYNSPLNPTMFAQNLIRISPTNAGVNQRAYVALEAAATPQGTVTDGNYVGGLFSAKTGSANGSGIGVWAINTGTRLDSGYTGVGVGIEVDLDNQSNVAGNTVGISVLGTGKWDSGLNIAGYSGGHYTQGVVVSNASTSATFNVPANATAGLVMGGPSTGSYPYLHFLTDGSPVFEVQNTGNVGIGTASTSYPLTIQAGGSGLNRSVLRLGDEINYHRLSVAYNNSASATGVFPAYTGGLYMERGGGFGTHGGLVLATDNNAGAESPIIFTTANTERMRVTRAGNIGIGTTTPQDKLDVNGNILLGGNTNTFAGTVGFTNANGPAVQFWGSGTANSGRLFLNTANAVRMTVDSSGNVGIGTTTPTAQLSTTGTVRFSNFGAGTLTTDASGNLSVSSDERLKNIDGAFGRGLTDILKLNPVSYHWNGTSGLDTSSQYAGFSAQNVQTAIPEAVGSSTNGYLTLQDRPLIAALVNAVRELAGRIGDLTERVTTKELVAMNGNFKHVQADAIDARTLCLDGICITKDQLAAILAATGQPGVSPSTSTLANTSQAPVIELNGNASSTIKVSDTYNDLGARIVAPENDINLGIVILLDGATTSAISIDTTAPGEHTILYTVTSPTSGLTGSAMRTVIVFPATQSSEPPANDNPFNASPANDNVSTSTLLNTEPAAVNL